MLAVYPLIFILVTSSKPSVARYDSSYGKNLGPAKAIKRDDGEVLNPTDIISGVVQPDEHVWVTFEDSES
ncbi:hypothetical protein BLNAU_15823 [Blattamonas nauphoetae]|uniref:Uncharacterized protein n=1 Tax=Blattamonas nauphoetae TaxID=2049346 RepID=A0ABQ9XD05_9EUKA|nr:hypothetical protein BLNAU_15823 [Blattamonas nauphoetae]